ncbi:hypothetical protein BS78_05G053200 [Paspalum vaginatum]|nr:hypothetical protein BS78_05G053200 [Paspalum vaginatum]
MVASPILLFPLLLAMVGSEAIAAYARAARAPPLSVFSSDVRFSSQPCYAYWYFFHSRSFWSGSVLFYLLRLKLLH